MGFESAGSPESQQSEHEGGADSPRIDIFLIEQLKSKIDQAEGRLQDAEDRASSAHKQNLILKQMNYFNQQHEARKDNDLFDSNFKLTQELIKKENMIQKLNKEVKRLKETKMDEGAHIIDNLVFQPTPELMKMLNKETIEHKAIQENT